MIDERLILAIGRMERALSRLETSRLETVGSETDAPETAGIASAQPASDPALAARHGALRACMTEAVTRIDALLAADAIEPPLAAPAFEDEPGMVLGAVVADGEA